jgi:hypothetical protein
VGVALAELFDVYRSFAALAIDGIEWPQHLVDGVKRVT